MTNHNTMTIMLSFPATIFAVTAMLLFLSVALVATQVSAVTVKQAVVVGAGPAGMSTALVLARRHGCNVTILEAAERVDVFDPAKAYPFLIRERGQALTKMFPDLHAALEKHGVAVEGATKMVSIPSDPNEVVDTEPKPITIFVPTGTNYWIRRHEFNRILLDCCDKEEKITILNGVECESVAPHVDDIDTVEISAVSSSSDGGNNDEKKKMKFTADLLIACDGMKSKVRASLAQSPTPFSEWKNSNPKGFHVKKWMSPSSGLQFKTIQLNSEAKVPIGDEAGSMYEIPFGVQTFHTIRSIHKSPKSALSLGLLPCKEYQPTRTFNVIRYDDHDIWQIKDPNKLREWFAEAFPRFDFSTDTDKAPLIEQEEFERFVTVPGLHLPPCQYSPELYVSSPSSTGAVVLVGDAVHCFPPDLGEGVNSGLEDVVALDKALSENDQAGDVAQQYALERGRESKALVKMVRFGAPFQYGQFGGIRTVQRVLWVINFFSRMLLNKATMGLTPQPVFVEVGDASRKYSAVMRRADTLTAILWTLAGTIILKATGLIPRLVSLF
jgi:kynurenine 3-monooxygenase